MTFPAVLEALTLLDAATVTGHEVAAALKAAGVDEVGITRLAGKRGEADFVSVTVPGISGRRVGGSAPTLGIVGHLGGIGARPTKVGIVSDADGAVAALACALKLGRMGRCGDRLRGDVMISTHICPRSPLMEHPTVQMVDSPIEMATLNRHEVRAEMEAVLSINTARGNRVINHRGFAISPAVKAGWILRVPEDLLTIMQHVTGRAPTVLPITMQDITPYNNGLFHINSILQPATVTEAPVVAVPLTAEVPVPGSATGVSSAVDIDLAVRFCLEVAKAFGEGTCAFYDPGEWDEIQRRYGSMLVLQTHGRASMPPAS